MDKSPESGVSLAEAFKDSPAGQVHDIIYGRSVKRHNVDHFMREADIDGCTSRGAFLKMKGLVRTTRFEK